MVRNQDHEPSSPRDGSSDVTCASLKCTRPRLGSKGDLSRDGLVQGMKMVGSGRSEADDHMHRNIRFRK
jgi:hypothetical protein